MKKIFVSLLLLSFVFLSENHIYSNNRNCLEINNPEECYDMGCEWIVSYEQVGNELIIREECVDPNNENNDGWNDSENYCEGLSEDECWLTEGCQWYDDEGCYRSEDSDNDGEDEENIYCSDIDNPYECSAIGCEWEQSNNMPGGGSCVEGHDDGEEWACMADCSGFEDLNEHDGYFCDWLLDVFPTGCAYDCNQDILNQIEEWMIECDESNEDNWDDNENYCEGLTEDECFITDGCQWYEGEGCYRSEDSDNDGEDEENIYCSDIDNPEECFAIGCEWEQSNNMPGGGSCVEGHDDGEEWGCMTDCPGFEDLNEDDVYFCDWLLDVFPTGCAYDCNQDILNQIEEWMIECDESNEDDCNPDLACGAAITCCDGLLYPTTCCSTNCDEPIGECENNNFDGCQWENGDWYEFGHEIFIDNCEYYECTYFGWEGPFELDSDECTNYDEGSPPECLMDCEGIENINPEQNPYEACDWIISIFSFDPGFASCTADCDDDVMMMVDGFVESCYECLENDAIDCADIFDDECGPAGLNEDGCCDYQSLVTCFDEFGNQDECIWDCPNPGVPSGSTSIEFDLAQSGNVSLTLTSECGDVIVLIDNEFYVAGTYSYAFSIVELGLITGAYQLQMQHNENTNSQYIWVACGVLETECSELNYADCIESEECDWMIVTPAGGYGCVESDEYNEVCEDLNYEECIDSNLCQPNYNAAGGFENCQPINNQPGFGSLYGRVEYIYGDVIDFVSYATLHIESMPSNADMFNFEVMTDAEGYYYIDLPAGYYVVTAYVEDESLSQDIQVFPNAENELNFLLGDWGGPWNPTANLDLGSSQAVPGGNVNIPLYLSSSDFVGGVQFIIETNMPNTLYPIGIESWDPCFSADYNAIDDTGFIGIIFSLEGCAYPPEDMLQIAEIVFEVSNEASFGDEIELFFNNVIVSDAIGNEIPSYGNGSVILIGAQGDVNADGEFNVLDAVMIVTFALYTEDPTDSQFWASDLNNDGSINILDVVQLVNLILGD